ncbi:hypothetical protein CDN99_06645 [Roseateles aquatilis]|uniref:Uncharacterized protein n=1 Tax=Roseateles aquatilis TaxID=431061 RepID=A0A246JHE7_9BURK|nr:hypothetical protein [Roseateles aquatilis]OWQ92031.1 hypothetical protein CDN99_06645 [Roseateles aquatilis]
MPMVSLNQTAFTSGQLSPRVRGRTDIDRYGFGLKLSLNGRPVIQGGWKRREGSLRNADALTDVARSSIAVPFVQGDDQAWILEFGHLKMRVYNADRTYAGIEIASPYTSAQLYELDWCQSDSTMWVFHPNVPTQRVEHPALAVWALSAAPFSTIPFDEVGFIPATTGTLSLATVGTGRTLTAGAPTFLASDVGRAVLSDAGIAVITTFTSTTVVTVEITRAFQGTVLAASNWTVDSSPQATCTPQDLGSDGKADPVGSIITLTLSADGWRAADVGSMVRINGGLVKITAWTSATVVSGRILRELAATVAAPALSWSLEPPVWSATLGYPRTGAIHQQRLIAAGTKKFPRNVWGSRIGEPLDFERWTNDNDAFAFTIDSDESTPIRYVSAGKRLIVLTESAEYTMYGGANKPSITPTNVTVDPESNHGCAQVRPVQINRENLFVQRAGRKIRALGYRYDIDGFNAPDLTALSDRITLSGVVAMAYAQEAEQTLWACLANGRLISCTIDRDQQPSVVAWAPHTTDGFVEWVTCIPTGDRDQVWLIVQRQVNGVTKRYLESLDDTFQPWHPSVPDPAPVDDEDVPRPTYGCTVDCGVVIDNAAGQTDFSVPHLAGREVDIVADGAKQPRQVVAANGAIKLARASKRTLIGLPFRTHGKMLTPEMQGMQGSAQGKAMRTGNVSMLLLESIGGKIRNNQGDEDELAARVFGAGILDKPPMPFTGPKDVTKLGWKKGVSEISIIQDDPMPLHVLAIVRDESFTG